MIGWVGGGGSRECWSCCNQPDSVQPPLCVIWLVERLILSVQQPKRCLHEFFLLSDWQRVTLVRAAPNQTLFKDLFPRKLIGPGNGDKVHCKGLSHLVGREHKLMIDRLTKHFLPLTKLTYLSSEWKVGGFCKFSKWFLVFSFLKIIEFKFVHDVVFQSKTNKDKSTEIFSTFLLKPTYTDMHLHTCNAESQ